MQDRPGMPDPADQPGRLSDVQDVERAEGLTMRSAASTPDQLHFLTDHTGRVPFKMKCPVDSRNVSRSAERTI